MVVVNYDDKARAQIAAMVAAEARHLAARQAAEPTDCPCRDGMFPSEPPDRRRFLFAAGSSVGAAAAAFLGSAAQAADGKPPAGAVLFDVAADPTREQGRPVAADGGYGSRSQFETEARR